MMKRVEMLAYLLIVTNCSTICYYEKSVFAASLGCFFLAILILGILREIDKWMSNDENSEP